MRARIILLAALAYAPAASADHTEARAAAPGDIEVTVSAQPAADTGPKSVPVRIQVTNTSDRWVWLDRAHAVVEVLDGEDTKCSGLAGLSIPALMAPGESFTSAATNACALGGEGSIVATLVFGDDDPRAIDPRAVRVSAATTLRANGEIAALDGPIPPARVDVESLAHPATMGDRDLG